MLRSNSLPRLLVIDDEPGICLAISILLQNEFSIVTSETAEDGLAKLVEPFTLILLDLRMPGVEGYELLEKVRLKAGDTPVVILSALGDQRTFNEVIARGAMTLIEKPFSRQELLGKIHQVLGWSQ